MSFKEILRIPGVFAVLFTLFMTSFGFAVIFPILPFYSLSLGAKPFELGMLTATFAFTSLIFGPVMGKLADRYGRRKILLISTAGFIVPYLVFAYSTSLWQLFVARAFEGIFAAGIFPACIALLSDYTTDRQRGKAMGLISMSFSLGFILGPAFGGLVSAAVSVSSTFIFAALFTGLNFISVFLQVKEPHGNKDSKDIAQKEVALLSHLSSPLLFLFLSTFIVAFMIGGLDATLALYTSERMGFTSAEVGLIFTFIGALIMIMQFVTGSLVNKYGEIRLIAMGFLLSGLGFFLLTFTTDWVTLLIPLAVFVSGNVMVFPSVTSLITKRVTGKKAAVLGLVSSFQSLGQVVGPLAGGLLYGIHHSYAFIGMATMIFAFFIAFVFIGRKQLMQKIDG